MVKVVSTVAPSSLVFRIRPVDAVPPVTPLPIFLATRKKGSAIKNLVDYILPKSGEGPSEAKRINGYYNLRFYLTVGNKTYVSKVIGDMDPGYGSTSKMLAESAICLAKDKLPNSYGVLTPSSAMGDSILKRLQMKNLKNNVNKLKYNLSLIHI